MSGASRIVLLLGPRAATDALRAALTAAIVAAGGAAQAEAYVLADEQPVYVMLGKRPGSPYPALDLIETDLAEDGRLRDAIASALSPTAAQAPLACWIYAPVSEVLARSPQPPGARHIHLAFTNPAADREAEYNAWYSGDHLAHALEVDGFATAQRFALTADGGGDASPYRYLTIYGLRTDDVRAAEDDMHAYATGEKPGMPLSSALGPVRATWVYTPTGS